MGSGSARARAPLNRTPTSMAMTTVNVPNGYPRKSNMTEIPGATLPLRGRMRNRQPVTIFTSRFTPYSDDAQVDIRLGIERRRSTDDLTIQTQAQHPLPIDNK